MRMPPAFFFMKDDSAGLIVQAQMLFCHLDCGLESFDGNLLLLWRAQAQREQKFAASCAFRNCFGFLKRVLQIFSDEAAYFMQFDVLVVTAVQKVPRQLAWVPSL